MNPQLETITADICQTPEKERNKRKQMKTSTDIKAGERSSLGDDDNLEQEVRVPKHMQAAQPKEEIPFIPPQDSEFWIPPLDPEDLFPELRI
jgi:hypothetical protein